MVIKYCRRPTVVNTLSWRVRPFVPFTLDRSAWKRLGVVRLTQSGGGGGNRTRVLRCFYSPSPGAVCVVSTRPHQSCTRAGV